MINFLKFFFHIIGGDIIRLSTLNNLLDISNKYQRLHSAVYFLNYVAVDKLRESFTVLDHLKSQNNQDFFVLLALNFKKKGYFVDFGATDGKYMNNTWILEKKFNWKGIVAEPGKQWRASLQQNRTCSVSYDCIWKKTGDKVLFNEIERSGFSTINNFSMSDKYFESRKNGYLYYVKTISLNDLLYKFNAPADIDYISIDTEGSEFDIISEFDFLKWNVSIFTIEHNYTENRNKIKNIFKLNGYERVLTSISGVDDWYVKNNIANQVKKFFR